MLLLIVIHMIITVENVLESLFATPVKIATPCKTEETYSHDSILDRSVTSVQEGSVTMKEKLPTGVTSNEKAQNAGYEIENNLGTGAALPGHDGDEICKDVNEVESFDKVLDGSATSVQELSEAMKENVATEVTSIEKANTAEYEIGGNLGTGAALSDNGGDDICEDVNEVERVLDGSVTRIQECSEAMKESVATGVTSNEKAHNAGYEVGRNLGTGAALSNNGGDTIFEDVNEVESFELLNTSTGVLFEAEYDGCEALEDQLTHSKEEWLLESNTITEEYIEEQAIPLAESCLNDEETEKSIISVYGSPQDLYELMSESRDCKSEAHNKFKGDMTQSTTSELSDANLQKSEVPENSHLPAACTNDHDNLRETTIKTPNDPEVENIGSSIKGSIYLIVMYSKY